MLSKMNLFIVVSLTIAIALLIVFTKEDS